jgi:hypothetical protein
MRVGIRSGTGEGTSLKDGHEQPKAEVRKRPQGQGSRDSLIELELDTDGDTCHESRRAGPHTPMLHPGAAYLPHRAGEGKPAKRELTLYLLLWILNDFAGPSLGMPGKTEGRQASPAAARTQQIGDP